MLKWSILILAFAVTLQVSSAYHDTSVDRLQATLNLLDKQFYLKQLRKTLNEFDEWEDDGKEDNTTYDDSSFYTSLAKFYKNDIMDSANHLQLYKIKDVFDDFDRQSLKTSRQYHRYMKKKVQEIRNLYSYLY